MPPGVEAVPVLEHAREVALGGEVAGRGAGDLHREVVLGPGGQRLGDLEGVGHEVPLGVAEVRAVEPHVALVEEAVERQPGAAVGGRCRRVEGAAVQEGSVGVGERRRRPPVARHLHALPAVGVEVVVLPGAPQVLVGDGGPPGARELHRVAPSGARSSDGRLSGGGRA
jgi:hypothetical protein